MKSEKLFKKIGVILNELQDQYDYLMENQGVCNELEYSLFTANADFLADHAKILLQLKQEESLKTVEEDVPFNKPNPVIEESNYELSNFEFNLSNTADETPQNTIIDSEIDKFTESTVEEVGPEPFLIKQDNESVSPSINELFHSRLEKSAEESSNQNKISDLKQGINLNDKLLYIKDLFNGYNLAYSEAIDLANKLPDFKAADDFFQRNYAKQYNWSEKPSTVNKFYELLKSKF